MDAVTVAYLYCEGDFYMVSAKKIIASLMVGTMIAVAAPVGMALDSQSVYSVASAAKGGAKFSAPKPAPKAAPKTNAAPSAKSSESKSVSGNGKDYKPSKDAKSLEKDAPGTNAAAKGNTAGAAAAGDAPRRDSADPSTGRAYSTWARTLPRRWRRSRCPCPCEDGRRPRDRSPGRAARQP